MADIILEQGQTLPAGTRTRYKQMPNGTYALVVTVAETEIGGLVPHMDTATRAQVIIPVVHHKVHDSAMFTSSYKSDDDSPIADDAAIRVYIITGAVLFPHYVFQVSAGGDAEVQFYENTTASPNGTPLAEVSLNRAQLGIATMQTLHTPTVTLPGDRLLTAFLPGGTFPRAGGGIARTDAEWILKRDTRYMIVLINRAGAAQPLGIVQTWYEAERA